MEGIVNVTVDIAQETVKFMSNPEQYLKDTWGSLEKAYEEYKKLSSSEKAEFFGKMMGQVAVSLVPGGVAAQGAKRAAVLIKGSKADMDKMAKELEDQFAKMELEEKGGPGLNEPISEFDDSEIYRHAEDSRNEGTGNLKYKKISETPAEDVNKWWKEEMGYSEPPYKPGTLAQEIELTEKSTFVRVYDGENSGMYGGWFMKADDIKGLTPSQIQDNFALPTTPKFVADVELDAGTRIRTGTANPLFGYEGGGQQFDLMGQRAGNFTNPRPLP